MPDQCTSCNMPKATLTCGHCAAMLCKKCVQKLEKNSFPFLEPLPPELSHKTYCIKCFDQFVDPALASYADTMKRAKGLVLYHKGQGEETRLFSRKEKPLQIEGCSDKAEATLRLAFAAASKGFNALIDAEIVPKKVRNGGHHTTTWSGTGIPTTVDVKKIEERDKPGKRLLTRD